MKSRDTKPSTPPLIPLATAIGAALLLSACAGGGDSVDSTGLPRLAAATGAALPSCTDLVTRIQLANTTITACLLYTSPSPRDS